MAAACVEHSAGNRCAASTVSFLVDMLFNALICEMDGRRTVAESCLSICNMTEAPVSLGIAESSVVCCTLDLVPDTVFREWWPLVAQSSNSSSVT